MQYEVTFAGFGGQGVMAIGQILANAAMKEGKHVVWLPSYGPEMRGGTAFCTVVIADQPVGSPIVASPRCAVVFNRPSFEKFEPTVRKNGLLLVNSSLIDVESKRNDIDQLCVQANDVAIKAGNPRGINMVMLGAFVQRSGVLPMKPVREAISSKLTNKQSTLALNLQVFDQGVALAKAS